MQSSQSDYDHLFKLLLIGNSGVGQSCMLMRYSENSFTNNFYNTIGVDFWDTAGQDRFRTITCSYYRGAHGILIVYDVTDRQSFENVKTWMVEIDKYAQENVDRMLIGNKCDISDRRQIPYEEGLELAKQYQIPFMETSAKEAQNIDLSFTTIARNIMQRVGSSAPSIREQRGQAVRLNQQKQKVNPKGDFDNCC